VAIPVAQLHGKRGLLDYPRRIEPLLILFPRADTLAVLLFVLDTRPEFAYPRATAAIETGVLFLEIFEDFFTHKRR
jgi:hypothetical protein